MNKLTHFSALLIASLFAFPVTAQTTPMQPTPDSGPDSGGTTTSDPTTGGGGGTTTGGTTGVTGSSDCCTSTPILWHGVFPKPVRNHVRAYWRERRTPPPSWPYSEDSDLWWGDDECYQSATTNYWGFKPTDTGGAGARADVSQRFELVDWSMFTIEVGFPADHIHPYAEIRGQFVWTYSGDPAAPNTVWPGIKLDCTVTANSAVHAHGDISLASSQALSAGKSMAYVEWWHPCMCLNSTADDGRTRTPLFTDDRIVSGSCQKIASKTQYVQAKWQDETGSKSRETGMPNFLGAIPLVSWGNLVLAELKDPHFSVTFAAPQPGRAIYAETNDDRLEIDWRCTASVIQTGSCDNGFASLGVASGNAWASASIFLHVRDIRASAMPVPVFP